jgi:tetratricopeptide (TPR) repeat protein
MCTPRRRAADLPSFARFVIRSRSSSAMAERKAMKPRPSGVVRSRWGLSNTLKRSLDLAALYRSQGRFPDAEAVLKRILAIYEGSLGPEHANVAQFLNNLAALYQDQGRLDDAEPLLTRSLSIVEKILGPEHPHVAEVLINLATHYRVQRRYPDAEALLKRSLAIYDKALGPEHPSLITPLNSLAALYRDAGRDTDAEAILKRSLAIDEKAQGPELIVPKALSSLADRPTSRRLYASARTFCGNGRSGTS